MDGIPAEFRGILQNSVTNCDGIPGEICDGIPLDTLNLPLRNEFESIFDLDEDRIILEADKKVGYVCLLKTDIYLQYDKIIKEQHFGATSINESWYINNIKGFIEEARSALPPQLSNIIKPKDFDWEFTNAEIGVLRLQPKVLKLKSISHDCIAQLKSRGIKSSMRDPIKVVQIILLPNVSRYFVMTFLSISQVLLLIF